MVNFQTYILQKTHWGGNTVRDESVSQTLLTMFTITIEFVCKLATLETLAALPYSQHL